MKTETNWIVATRHSVPVTICKKYTHIYLKKVILIFLEYFFCSHYFCDTWVDRRAQKGYCISVFFIARANHRMKRRVSGPEVW